MRLGDTAHGRCRHIERFIPIDAYPSRVGVAFGARPFQRMQKPVLAVDQLRRRPPLGAKRFAGWVLGVGTQRDELARLHRCDRTTACKAKRTVCIDLFLLVRAGHAQSSLRIISNLATSH